MNPNDEIRFTVSFSKQILYLREEPALDIVMAAVKKTLHEARKKGFAPDLVVRSEVRMTSEESARRK